MRLMSNTGCGDMGCGNESEVLTGDSSFGENINPSKGIDIRPLFTFSEGMPFIPARKRVKEI